MTERQVMFFVCDDVFVSMNGKYTISGMYTGDIVIPQEPAQLPQLIVMFEIRTPISHPFESLVLQVSIPGEAEPRTLDISFAIPRPLPTLKGRKSWSLRYPFLISAPNIKSGAIAAKIIHEGGELAAGKQWVVTVAEAQANLITMVAAASGGRN